MTTLPMRYFGRGSARVLMPRAVTRRARREWVVNPSVMIFFLSLAVVTLQKLTFDEPIKLARPRTIIVLPQAPPVPIPAVRKPLSAYKKAHAKAPTQPVPNQEALKRVPEMPKPVPRPRLAPPVAKAEPVPRPSVPGPRATIRPPVAALAVGVPTFPGAAEKPRDSALPMAPPRERFSPLPLSDAGPKIAVAFSPTRGALAVSRPRAGAPTPPLPQLAAPSPVVPTRPIPNEGAKGSGHRFDALALERTPSPLPMPPSALTEKETVDVNTRVLIKGSTLEHSLRVQTLKEEIYRKTRHMPPGSGPYTYRILAYRCTVVISGGPLATATLTFEPSDAPFEVVSALERLLPRRTL